MKVLVVGSGGREHALCQALAASPRVGDVLCAPGNAGIAESARCTPVSTGDLDGLEALARETAVDLVVVGPEQPLVAGLVDRLEAHGIAAFGPSAEAARLEGSKAFMKAFCERHAIPTAPHRTFSAVEAEAARAHLDARPLPVVIKADGLAAGKGVVVATSLKEARDALAACFGGGFGEAGGKVVIEDALDGREVSLFALCDGRSAVEIGTARDYKRALDGDRGPNTGGMGAISPVPDLDEVTRGEVMDRIVRPTVQGMAAEGRPFRGILYAGLMLTAEGPRLLEFNVRFGDPECQALLPRLDSDLAGLLLAASEGRLDHLEAAWTPRHAVTVVLASEGYPGPYRRGTEIRGLERLQGLRDVEVLHAATARQDGRWLAEGGRVLNVTGLGETREVARERAYAAIARIDWPEGYYRQDIGA